MNCLSFQSTHFHHLNVNRLTAPTHHAHTHTHVRSEMGLLMSKMKARYSRIIAIRPTGWAGDVKHVRPTSFPLMYKNPRRLTAGGRVHFVCRRQSGIWSCTKCPTQNTPTTTSLGSSLSSSVRLVSCPRYPTLHFPPPLSLSLSRHTELRLRV
jgi:hypothetical protein